jgi:hypothetical protein
MPRTSGTLQAGAKIALQHGARSPRVYSPLAEALIEATLEQRPDLCRYPDLVSSWAGECSISLRALSDMRCSFGISPELTVFVSPIALLLAGAVALG